MTLSSLGISGQELVYKDEKTSALIKYGLDKMYNLEFEESEKTFAEVRKKYPKNPAYEFLMAMNTYVKMFANNTYKEKSAENLNYLLLALEKTKALDKKYPNNAEVIFYYMSIYSSITLYYSQRKETMKAINYAKKTYDYLRTGYSLKDTYHELYFSAGIYDFYREQYPETHPGYKSFMWLFAEGGRTKGVKELEFASNNALFTRTEAHAYLTTINIKYLTNFTNAATHAEYLHKKFPNNLIFTTRCLEAYLLAGRYDEAEKLLPLLANTNKKTFDMAFYLFKGAILEKRDKKLDNALAYYAKGLQVGKLVEFPVNDFLGHGYIGLGRIYKQKGDTKKANYYFEKTVEESQYESLKKEAKSNLD